MPLITSVSTTRPQLVARSDRGRRRFWQPLEAVGLARGALQRRPAVGANEQPRPALAERLDTPVLDGGHPVVDQVEIHLAATVERRRGESQGDGEVGMIRCRRHHETELALRRIHDGAERSIATGEGQ